MPRNLISALAAIFVGAGAGMVTPHPYPVKAVSGRPKQLGQAAEQTFRLGRGVGRQLMTQEEWREHQQKIKCMSQSEREKYPQEWQNKMTERAHEKGMTPPDTPRRGKGAGPGKGQAPGRSGSGSGPSGGR
jgi:hypothetical protein